LPLAVGPAISRMGGVMAGAYAMKRRAATFLPSSSIEEEGSRKWTVPIIPKPR